MSSSQPHDLQNNLHTKQLTMIAIGGVIGAGLFVGSGNAISQAGPAVLLAYLGVGGVVVLAMRMLAELSVAEPDSGSFSTYATRTLGPWAGLAVGWLYAYMWCVVIGYEATVGASIVSRLVPVLPTWLVAFVLLAALIGVNCLQVGAFGTFEYWFAMIKVAAIVAFMVVALAALAGLVPGFESPGLSNITDHGGFAPQGLMPVLVASLTVFFSYVGSELVTVAAGEAENPGEAVRTAMNSVIWRILLFYVGSIGLVVLLLPWNSASVTQSPYVAVLDTLGVPGAALAMDLIVLTAVLSCLNSGIYSASRMLHSMARHREAPAVFARANAQGVPVAAVLGASVIGLFTAAAAYVLPSDTLFTFLLDSSGSIALVVYGFIAVTQLVSRTRRIREGRDDLAVKMWLHPWLSILTVVLLAVIAVGMVVETSTRHAFFLTLLVTVVCVVAGLVMQRRARVAAPADAAGAAAPPLAEPDVATVRPRP